MVQRQLDIYLQKNGVGPLPHTIYKNKLEMIKHLNITAEAIKHSQETIGANLCDLRLIS